MELLAASILRISQNAQPSTVPTDTADGNGSCGVKTVEGPSCKDIS